MATKSTTKFKPKVPEDAIQVGTVNNEEVKEVIQEGSNSEPVAQEESQDVVLVEEDSTKIIPDMNVKIKVGSDYSCCIGGERYFFEKGKTYIVPKNVKNILSREENLLKPL